MAVTTRLRKRLAIVVMVTTIAVATSACFPDVAPGEPADPYSATLYQLINQSRANAGVPALSYSPKLTNQAGTWSWQMASDNWLRHQNLAALLYSPDYAAFYSLGENIIVAPGYYSPAQLHSAWMNSAPHRGNILSRNFNVVGIGVYWGPDGRLWATVDFGTL